MCSAMAGVATGGTDVRGARGTEFESPCAGANRRRGGAAEAVQQPPLASRITSPVSGVACGAAARPHAPGYGYGRAY